MVNMLDPATRYREYLRGYGIAEAGDRVAELRDLDLGNIRFFAYASSDGVRLKAAATPNGLVTPGGRAGDDWHGFLSRMPDAAAAAECIAWLETDASTTTHELPGLPTAVLAPDRPLAAGIDPAQWAFVTAPALLVDSDDSAKLVAWFLATGTRTPTRWTITARPNTNAVIERASALDLLTAYTGSDTAAAIDATERARRLLATGSDDERSWALRHIGDTVDRASVLGVAALLTDAGVSSNTRLQALGTLARLADPAAVTALGAMLRADAMPEVRRASAQALGRIGGGAAVQALIQAASDEPNVIVRAEIVHALVAQGSVARPALARIARDDPDATVREVASSPLAKL